ncbi:MAG: EAL domain-containing protein [Marinobacter sp.]|uniref:putative bifunctional diguanylate cyclase/phosphodiesterase n=1 Tax=Marinobacter sp. TaxID=50741 RepID=UPI00299E58DF|nr:EAL domain-containing protein [Marinobacter sp.]MDX1756946.1 EAL domain-containing protein [Marinobacter sp.]
MQAPRPATRQIVTALLSPALPVLILVLFLAIAVFLKHGTETQQDRQLQAALTAEAQGLARDLERQFAYHVQALNRMASRLADNPALTEASWRADARNYLDDFGIYQAIEWIDRNYVIRWLEPVAGNEQAIGFNVAFSPARRQALAQAAATGQLDSTGVIELEQGGTGLVIYAPVGAGSDNRGFIAGVFRMASLASSLMTERVRSAFHIEIHENGELAYQLNPEPADGTGYVQRATVDLPNAAWQISLTPTRAWLASQRGQLPWITFSVLLVMGLLVSLSTLLIQLVLKRHQDLLKTRSELDQEIHQRQLIQQDLARLESTDTLTGLANRRFFMEDLSHALSLADRHQRQVALIMIDLDRFQTLNDSLGHQFGDELLIKVSERLNVLGDERVLVAYSGGDEFMVCQQHVDDIDDVIHLLGQLQKCFHEPFAIQGQIHSITATMGIAVYPQSGLDADVLLRNADIALYRAKESGRNAYQFYTEGMQEREVRRLELDKDLSIALEQDQFVLHLQPKLDLATLKMDSVEALIRWQHPTRGLVPPFEFIPLAEESGRITDIGHWVVMAACRQLAAWRQGPLAHLRIAVNLSGRELDDEHLVDNIQQALAEYQVPPDRLEVELTEEIFIQNIERNRNQLVRLHDLGIRLAIDDFGVGYSSLAYLRDFPVDLLKIDRSFITNVTERHDDAVITRAVINLAHNLGVRVVAEGVETEQQLQFLQEHQCDYAQGYLISRPVGADQLEALLQDDRFPLGQD